MMKISAQNITEGTELIASDGHSGVVAESDAEYITPGQQRPQDGGGFVVIWLNGAPRRFRATQMVEVAA